MTTAVSHPYDPRIPGSWIKFTRYAIQAKYFPDTMDFQLTAAPVLINDGQPNPMQRTVVVLNDACYPASPMVWQNGLHVAPPDWDMWCNSLYTVWWDDGAAQRWLGESGGMQIGWYDGSSPAKSPAACMSLGFPPEPQLPIDIDAYHAPVTGTTRGLSFNRTTLVVAPVSLDWKFRNWGRGPGVNESWEWGNMYPFQLRTVLEERPGTRAPGNNVFMYDWAKNVGPICMWQGEVRPDLSIASGLMWQIADHGLTPP